MISAASALLLALSLGLWIAAVRRAAQHLPVLAWTPRRPVPWGLGEIVLILLLFFGVLGFVGSGRIERFSQLDAGQQRVAILSLCVGTAGVWFASIVLLRLLSGATAEDLGFQPRYTTHDLRVAIVAYFMLMPPTMTLNWCLEQMWHVEQRHPFIDAVTQDPRREVLMLILVSAVFVAPWVEEYLFRVMLQGWLEKLLGVSAKPSTRGSELEAPSAAAAQHVDREATDEREAAGPNGPPALGDIDPTVQMADQISPRTRWVPIAISSLLFALGHIGHGLAPISLFVLALGLGYLYQRTHRVLPGVIVHLLFNLGNVLALWWQVTHGA